MVTIKVPAPSNMLVANVVAILGLAAPATALTISRDGQLVAAAAGKDAVDLAQHVPGVFVAAIARRAADLKEPDLFEIVDRLGRAVAQLLAARGTAGEGTAPGRRRVPDCAIPSGRRLADQARCRRRRE